MASRVSSRRFVGREPQLAELTHVYEEAAGGRAWLALVAGESGVGKTRLVDELARRARDAGARVLFGDCVELAEGELPYAPLVGALRPLMRSGAPALDDVRAALDRPSADASAPQAHFFELLLGALDRLGAEQPLVLVLEDVHWADRSTRDFLAFLARNMCGERLLVVATFRTDELHRRHPLRPLLPEIERLDRTIRVTVERLTPAELAVQLADILGAEPEPALVDRLYARCEGNPLFAEELLAAGADGRGELPPTLRDALMVRVEALAEPTQELLRAVAAAVRADEALLGEVSGLDRAGLRAALREALAHHVLVGGDDGRYAFRHALLREALHDDLLPGERVELHLALARALEGRRAGGDAPDLDTVTQIAHHYAVAGEQPEAGDWAQAAARVAPERAPRHVGLTALYFDVVAGDLHLSRGDLAQALVHLQRAHSFTGQATDPQWRAPVAALLAEALRRADRFDAARAVLREAHEGLSAIVRMQDHGRMARLAAAALAVEADAAQRARDLADPDAEAHALARAYTWLERGRAVGDAPGAAAWAVVGEAEAQRAGGAPAADAWAAAAAAWDDTERPYYAAQARWRQAEALVRAGDRAAAQAPARAALAVARGLGAAWLEGEIGSLARRARLRLEEDEPDAPAPAPELGLTPREREVLELLAQGATNREIGERLFMAEKTASVHVSRILGKLDVRTRTEAAAVAHRLGIGA